MTPVRLGNSYRERGTVAKPSNFSACGGEYSHRRAAVFRKQYQSVRSSVQSYDPFALVFRSLYEFVRLPEHVRCFSEQETAQFNKGRAIEFLCAAN